jgi:hypothetical protein
MKPKKMMAEHLWHVTWGEDVDPQTIMLFTEEDDALEYARTLPDAVDARATRRLVVRQ